MDQNKQKKLREIAYVIPNACENCLHSIIKPGSDFGSCGLILFKHMKHSASVRSLSIYRGGRCEEFYTPSPDAERKLGAWAEFLERRKITRSGGHKKKVSY